jgi:D-glycero-alpha-D-manno-heptose 1-phosphate guanylyltransferase
MTSLPTDAIIMAGGLGTRLRPVVRDVPKPMAPVMGRPFLEYLMRFWARQGIRRFHLSIGYLGDAIEAHFGAQFLDCSVRYIREESPLGTGGGLRRALAQGDWTSEDAIMLNGDTWYEVDLGRLTADAGRLQLPITVAIKPAWENDRFGGIVLDANGRVAEFGERAPGAKWINGGTYYFDVARVRALLEGFPPAFSLEQDVLATQAHAGNVAASIQDCNFLDIGVPDDYARAPSILGSRT